MKRQANPQLSSIGKLALAQYEQVLRVRDDLTLECVQTIRTKHRGSFQRSASFL
jgi:hypothetical protein